MNATRNNNNGLAPIVIFGCGGHGREILQLIRDLNCQNPYWNVVGFLADPEFSPPSIVAGLPVLGGLEWLITHPEVLVAIGVGAPDKRFRIARQVAAIGRTCPNLIHPRAWIGTGVKLDEGCIVFAGSGMTTEIAIGAHVHINLGCTIGHDCTIGAFSSLYHSVGLSGNVRLGEGVECGTGARLIPGVSVGAWTILGAGAVVIKSLPSNVTAVGSPARVVKSRLAGWHEA